MIGVIAGIVIATALIAIIVFFFRWLWNSTMPEVFGVKTRSFGSALKILVLASILFGGHRVVEVPQQVSGELEAEAARTGP